MLIEEAIQAMREGKKIRRKSWPSTSYLSLHNDVIVQISFPYIIAMNDWEIYEEPKVEMKLPLTTEELLKRHTEEVTTLVISRYEELENRIDELEFRINKMGDSLDKYSQFLENSLEKLKSDNVKLKMRIENLENCFTVMSKP